MLLQLCVVCQKWTILKFSHSGNWNFSSLDVCSLLSTVLLCWGCDEWAPSKCVMPQSVLSLIGMKEKHDADSRAPHIWEVEGKSCHRKCICSILNTWSCKTASNMDAFAVREFKDFFFFLMWTIDYIFWQVLEYICVSICVTVVAFVLWLLPQKKRCKLLLLQQVHPSFPA